MCGRICCCPSRSLAHCCFTSTCSSACSSPVSSPPMMMMTTTAISLLPSLPLLPLLPLTVCVLTLLPLLLRLDGRLDIDSSIRARPAVPPPSAWPVPVSVAHHVKQHTPFPPTLPTRILTLNSRALDSWNSVALASQPTTCVCSLVSTYV